MTRPLLTLVSTFALFAASGQSFAAADANTCVGKTGRPGTFQKTLVSSGLERTFRLDVPEGYDPNRGAPLVFNFHGWGGTGESQAEYTGMAEAGGEMGYIVVHADGIDNSWNAGSCCGTAALQKIDDVQFVRDMVAAIGADYCVDPDRIHSTGFSNGGYLSHRLGCEANDLIASIAPVSGLIGVECAPGRGVAVHQSQGTVDPLVWYNNAASDLEEWAALNNCQIGPDVYYTRANVECIRWTQCDDDVDVEFCSLRAKGHVWVEGRFYDTTQENLDFFEAHPMP